MDGCEHEWVKHIKKPIGGKGSKCANVGANKNDFANMRDHNIETDFCTLCNAWRGSLGLEPTFELYIKHLCDIFSEVKRVLRKDGCCFVNMGDTYASGTKGDSRDPAKQREKRRTGMNINSELCFGRHSEEWFESQHQRGTRKVSCGLPSKSLCQIPSRFAIEMTNRGWILRNEIIWYKRNCMPSSASDRFTVNFEKVFFFTRSKKYWFEQQFETQKNESLERLKRGWDGDRMRDYPNGPQNHFNKYFNKTDEEVDQIGKQGRNKRCVWKYNVDEMIDELFSEEHSDEYRRMALKHLLSENAHGAVWDITTKPFKGAHFAVFPPKLVEPMLSAGCPEFVCTKCGKAREKIYDHKLIDTEGWGKATKDHSGIIQGSQSMIREGKGRAGTPVNVELGYTTCDCNAGFDGGWVLDPFAGAGTVGVVAKEQDKNFIGIELNPEYCDMADKRIEKS